MKHNDINSIPKIYPTTTSMVYDSIEDIRFNENTTLKILYMNARSIKNKLEELEFVLNTTKN